MSWTSSSAGAARAAVLLLALALPRCERDTTGDESPPADAGVSAADAAAIDSAASDSAASDSAVADSAEVDAQLPDAGTTTHTPAFAGDPTPGTVWWGAAVEGNGDPVARHEEPSGCALSLRRTFFQWSHRTGYLITIASDDLAHGRLPWVSVKTPSWADMAAGLHDDEIDELLSALDALQGPVWLTVHHEPEGGGGVNEPDDPAGPAGHVAMNRRVRERLEALGVDNVALAPILMTWTWAAASGRDPEEWWAPGIYDFLGVDHYQDSESTLLTSRWAEIRLWAANKGVTLAVGEWGMRGTDAAAGQRVRDWYQAAIASAADGAGARVVGLAAFDSGLNSPSGSWELLGEQLVAFQALLCDPRTAALP
jgi:hypothetical protein